MKSQEVRGKVKKIQGRVKEAAGIMTGDRKLEMAGTRERAEGAAQEGIAKARRQVGEAVEKVARKIKE